MKIKSTLSGLLIFAIMFQTSCAAQKNKASEKGIDVIINLTEVDRIERTLSADDMKGRKTFSADIIKAANFIADEFKAAGLKNLGDNKNYFQEFSMVRTKSVSATGVIDGESLTAEAIVALCSSPSLRITEASNYERIRIKQGAVLFSEARKIINSQKNALVLVDKSFASSFGNLNRLKSFSFKSPVNIVFILTDKEAEEYEIKIAQDVTEQKLMNVVGVLPGKKLKEEYVVFSGHYDHLGVGKPVDGDSIYNGANDDASGTTAVITLANYFKQLNNNERTLIFVAFTAEEIGGYGSQYFSKQLPADKVMAMFNIEMIGTDSKWGNNSAYITGYEKTDMGELLAKDLAGTEFTFHPDPYPQQQLFYRSDNATLARLGVPAHTISTSKMDAEPNYHKASDEIETLDLENMTRIIKSIAISAKSIIAGIATPTRVKVEDLR